MGRYLYVFSTFRYFAPIIGFLVFSWIFIFLYPIYLIFVIILSYCKRSFYQIWENYLSPIIGFLVFSWIFIFLYPIYLIFVIILSYCKRSFYQIWENYLFYVLPRFYKKYHKTITLKLIFLIIPILYLENKSFFICFFYRYIAPEVSAF